MNQCLATFTTALLLLPAVTLLAADDYAIDWYQIGSGAGTTSRGEDYALAGTIGQAAAGGTMMGAEFALTGGFGAVHALQTEGAPELVIYLTETTAVLVSWPAPSTGWELRQSVDPASAVWTVPAEPANEDGKVRFIVVVPAGGLRFYRLFAVDPAVADQDGDGLSDIFEQRYGFDPANPDQNHNGVPDGLDDEDGDGVSNSVELLLGLNPRDAFTYPPTRDNELDRDADHLTDAREAQLGTDWLRADTDGDRFTDDAELLVGKDPLNRRSYSLGVRLTQPTETIHRRLSGPSSPSAAVIAQPPVEAFAPGRSAGSVPQFHLGFPPVEVRTEPSP